MDILAHLLTGSLQASTPGPDADFWYESAGGAMTSAGLRVDADGAKKISAWFRGRDILATALAMIPLQLYERLPDDKGAELAKGHRLYDVLHRLPNVGTDSFVWRRQAMFDLIDNGWAYDWIAPGVEWSLRRIDPKLVTPEMVTSGTYAGRHVFHVRNEKTGQTTTHTQDEVFYRQASDGKGILDYARDSLGLARVTDMFAGKVFGNGSLNAGLIEVPGPMGDESARTMAQSFKTSVGDWHLPRVLPMGAKFVKDDGLTPDKAQMLLSRKFSINDIARWLGLPPHMLGDLDRATFSNIEHQGQEFVTYSLGPWLSLWEFAINTQLILQPNKHYAEFTRDALVRGDIATRWQAHVEAVNAGIKSVDEVRQVENLNRRGGKADELREPQNITGKPITGKARPQGGPAPAPPADDDSADKARAIVRESSARLLRKEQTAGQKGAIKHAADAVAFEAFVTDFYDGHVDLVAQTMQLSEAEARLYCETNRDALIAGGVAVLETWTPDYLVGRALDVERPSVERLALLAMASRPEARMTIADGAIQFHAAPTSVHQAPVTVNQAPVTVNQAPVKIEKGAIQHETHIAAPPSKTTVTKTVKRDGKNQIKQVIEESE